VNLRVLCGRGLRLLGCRVENPETGFSIRRDIFPTLSVHLPVFLHRLGSNASFVASKLPEKLPRDNRAPDGLAEHVRRPQRSKEATRCSER